MVTNGTPDSNRPLRSLEEWEDSVVERYPEPLGSGPDPQHKSREDYRNYEAPARASVREFYRLNHQHQTLDFVLEKKKQFLGLNRCEMSVWEAAEFLNTLVDDSDPDTDLAQLEHLLQTSEAIRADGHPDWFVLVGFLHDLGKILCLWDEPQWAVVGDTFPVGCAYSDKVVYAEFFAENPDQQDAKLQTPTGIYNKGCGLNEIHMSWGHDEYMYHVVKDYLPAPALAMIRYHSFYAWHREEAYQELWNDHDREMLPWVRKFNPYDLYSKSPVRPDFPAIKPYYDELFAKYLPPKLRW
jgi:inositol oxygenase